MNASSLESLLLAPQRKLVVCRSELNLSKRSSNEVFILMVEESKGSAGGRAAGSGSRRIDAIYGFICEAGRCEKIVEVTDQKNIEAFDIPYSAVAMDIILPGGESLVVQGLVDSGLIDSYKKAANNLK